MNFDAHPLVVAVALGLLGPGALEDDADSESSELSDCDGHRCVASSPPALGSSAPSPDEFHRVELEWLKQG